MDVANGWRIRAVLLSKPQLLVAQDSSNPELPSLPTSELVLPPNSSSRAFVGEECRILLVASHQHFDVSKPLSDEGMHSETKFPENIYLSAETESPQTPPQLVPATIHHPSAAQPYATRILTYTPKHPGVLKIRALLQLDFDVESRCLSKDEAIEVNLAVSIRFKVSRSAGALKAYVLEAQIENLTDTALTIEDCDLQTRNYWTYEKLGLNSEDYVVLRPNEVFQYAFVLRNGKSPEAATLSVSWRREPCGSRGWQTTAAVRI